MKRERINSANPQCTYAMLHKMQAAAAYSHLCAALVPTLDVKIMLGVKGDGLFRIEVFAFQAQTLPVLGCGYVMTLPSSLPSG